MVLALQLKTFLTIYILIHLYNAKYFQKEVFEEKK